MKIRTNLPLLIKNRNLSLRQLSQLTGIPRTYLVYFRDGRMVPSDEQLEAICQALKVTPDLIYPDDDVRRVLAEV